MTRINQPRGGVLPALVAATALASGPIAGAEFGERLEPLAWLTKRCWIGTFPDGATTDQHCYGWEYGDKFIWDRHVVRGSGPDYRGQTIYAWDPDQQQIVFWYWTNQGTFSTGEALIEGDVIVFPETHVGDEGITELRSELHREGEDAYRMAQRQKKPGADWEDLWTITYVDARRHAARGIPSIAPAAGQRWALAFSSLRDGQYEVYSSGLDGGNPVNLSRDPGTDWVTAGGARLLMLTRRGLAEGARHYRAASIDPAGGEIELLPFPELTDSQIGPATDGTRFAVSLHDGRDREIALIDRAGKVLAMLTDNDCLDSDPDISPDGRWIVYRSDCGGASDLWLMASDGSDRRRLTHDSDNDAEEGYGGEGPARFSPDGSRLVWMSWHDGDWDLWVMNADGSEPRALTATEYDEGYPSWSPDGRYIAYDSNADGDYEIYVMDADGAHPRRITFSPGQDQAPVWLVTPANPN